MIVPHTYEGQTVGILGLARTGLAAMKSLQQAGARVLAWDDTPSKRSLAGEALYDFYTNGFDALDALLLAPGIAAYGPMQHPLAGRALGENIPLISDFDLFEAARSDLPPHKLVVVTGTNGKSTTTALIQHILAECGVPAAMGGNIGVGVMSLPVLQAGGVYVLEASSYQLELTKNLTPDVSVLLNISPDHLERHATMEAYTAAKERLFQLQKSGARILGMDSESAALAARWPDAMQVSAYHETERGIYLEAPYLIEKTAFGPNVCGSIEPIPSLQGRHNAQNAAAAYAACRSLGLMSQKVMGAMQSFPGLEHRQEPLLLDGRVDFINDSKATNVDAALRALESFHHIRWIAGGKDKGEPLEPLLPALSRISKVYLIGQASNRFADFLEGKVEYEACHLLERAVARAYREAEKGDIILLSPACAAFDQFDNFEVRGDAFKEIAAEMTTGESG